VSKKHLSKLEEKQSEESSSVLDNATVSQDKEFSLDSDARLYVADDNGSVRESSFNQSEDSVAKLAGLLETAKELTPDEVFQSSVAAGIHNADGSLTENYKAVDSIGAFKPTTNLAQAVKEFRSTNAISAVAIDDSVSSYPHTMSDPASHGWLEQFKFFGAEAIAELKIVAEQGLSEVENDFLIFLSVELIELAQKQNSSSWSKIQSRLTFLK
jgi:hypothetical protein